MSRRKWRETQMQQSRARPGHQISCCLVALYFLCDILLDLPVEISRDTIWNCRQKAAYCVVLTDVRVADIDCTGARFWCKNFALLNAPLKTSQHLQSVPDIWSTFVQAKID